MGPSMRDVGGEPGLAPLEELTPDLTGRPEEPRRRGAQPAAPS